MHIKIQRFLPSHHATSMILSVALLSAALIILWLGHWVKVSPPDTLTIREVALAVPPPPPPPAPVVEQAPSDAPLTVQVQGAGPALQIAQLNPSAVTVSKPDAPAMDAVQPQWQSLEVNWDAFSLNDLDSLPTLLTPLHAVFPKSLSRRGINSALVKLDVLINEQGQVSLIDVLENPYPELKPEIDKIVRSSRFSAPTKDNETVRARFIWPVEIKS